MRSNINPDTQQEWYGKPYYSLDAWCKNTLGVKCYKIALNAHMTCPNRDGSLDTRGCIFCSAGGSGDFAVDIAGKSVAEQLREGISQIAYFQAYTNTYAPVSYLREIYTQALECPSVCGISIATRPDCLPAEVLDLLSELKLSYPDKLIWIELGLQTIHEQTARFIRRGYELPCFEMAYRELKDRGIPVIVHLILGLPGETRDMMLQNIAYMNKLRPFGVKLQLLHILRGTDLGDLYLNRIHGSLAPSGAIYNLGSQRMADIPPIRPLTKDEYLSLLIDCIRRLHPDIVIHRVTGDGPKDLLLAPLWSLNKRDVLNSLHHQMKNLHARQGDLL